MSKILAISANLDVSYDMAVLVQKLSEQEAPKDSRMHDIYYHRVLAFGTDSHYIVRERIRWLECASLLAHQLRLEAPIISSARFQPSR